MSPGRFSIGGLNVPVSEAVSNPAPAAAATEPDGTWRTHNRDWISEAWGWIREWLEERFLVAGTTLRRRDYARWQRAESVSDLCDLTVAWLTGEVASSPGYYGRVDVDEDEAPGLTEALVALNRSGFWTCTSQAGADCEGFDGAHWTQLASVDGFAGRAVIERLAKALTGTSYRIEAHPTREQGHGGVVVTRREGRAYTRLGGSMDDDDLSIQTAGVGERAAQAVRDGVQVVIWDPVAGRNDLWAALRTICQSPASVAAHHRREPPVKLAEPQRPDQDMKEAT